VSLAPADLYLNRELSLLAFNERVLAMATREDVPLAERLRYICIVSSPACRGKMLRQPLELLSP
jgi:polyphosphate kinase